MLKPLKAAIIAYFDTLIGAGGLCEGIAEVGGPKEVADIPNVKMPYLAFGIDRVSTRISLRSGQNVRIDADPWQLRGALYVGSKILDRSDAEDLCASLWLSDDGTKGILRAFAAKTSFDVGSMKVLVTPEPAEFHYGDRTKDHYAVAAGFKLKATTIQAP